MKIRAVEIFDELDAVRQMKEIGVSTRGIELMKPKAVSRAIRLQKVGIGAGNILKQEMLALGGEAAVGKDVITGKAGSSDCVLLGTLSQLRQLCLKLNEQPFGLSEIARSIERILDNYERKDVELRCCKHIFNFGKKTYLMGILNLTPDSFSGDGIYKLPAAGRRPQVINRAVEIAEQMVRDGADIIDVGGESTRPGARGVDKKEEIARVMPVINKLVKRIKVPISIDTTKSEIAHLALDSGVSIVNDITGLRGDSRLVKIAAKYNAGIIIMHIKGRPRTMQKAPRYDSLISEIIGWLKKGIEIAHSAGIGQERTIVDPGIGFGKTTGHNLEILKRLREFKSLGRPILVGTSGKSLIGSILKTPVDQRLLGTAATVAVAIGNGADIVRVHDVRQMAQVARMTDAIIRNTDEHR
ncbi:MAG: dihydropteroate synthase [Candidatus Omnitrophota bacterium]|nr:dihydropteroate synthase [Candidatus Omnitrophota bacterium]